MSSRHVGKASSLYSIEDKTLNVKKTFFHTKSIDLSRVDKIQWLVWNCPPKPRPYFFIFAHESVMQKRSIAHFGKEWEPGTQAKRALIYGIVWGNKSSSHLELWRDILSRIVVFFCAPITSGTSQSARTYLYTSCVFFPVVLAPRQRTHLWSCFTVHSPGFSRGKILPGTFFPSVSHFHVLFSFNSTFRFAILSCFNLAETFHFAYRHVSLHSRPPK